MAEKLYTENELIQYLGRNTTKRQGVDRLTVMCKQAGLIIKPVQETLKGKGQQILYRIIEDKINLPNEIWVDTYCSKDHEVSNMGRIRQKNTKKLLGYNTNSGKGYVGVGLGPTLNLRLHRVVFFSFYPEYLENEKLYVIHHKNGIRTDNRLDNLEVTSNIGNIIQGKEDQKQCQSILAQLLLKYGYEKTQEKLLYLLNEN